MYQGQIGGDFNLSFAASCRWTHRRLRQKAVNVGTFSGTCSIVKTGPFKGLTGCSVGIPKFYNNTDVTATLSNNTGLLLGQVHMACPDCLRRLRVAQAGGPEQRLSQRLPDHRRLERSCDHPLDHS